MEEEEIEAIKTKEELIKYILNAIDNAEAQIIHEMSTNAENDFDVLENNLKLLKKKMDEIL